MSITNDLSKMSYTNKDFNSIYTELLEYAKKISYKWDPSASDESDPGVVLLKLAALIGDKNNYNIDKSVLELMPGSVTQPAAARQLFDQCGYSMRYYQAATGTVQLTVSKHPEDVVERNIESSVNYKIPAFTMVSDIDNSVVYTISPNNDSLILTENKQSFNVLEGSAVSYTINNDPLITVLNLDNKNRLYFTDTNIAENGIFITNVGEENYTDWYACDNLEIQKRGSYCYKFGLTVDTSLPYIEFPRDSEELFGSGINIWYVKTSGKSGNIAAKKLKKFFSDTTFSSDRYEGISIPSTDIVVQNVSAITNGEDPETIDEAYVAYKRVKDTFSTLVTLKDYTDYMITSEHASNGYVCDRTNDIQRAYKVLEISDLVSVLSNYVDLKEETLDLEKDFIKSECIFKDASENTLAVASGELVREVPSMTSYDLCIYALEYVPNVSDVTQFRKTFSLVDGTSYEEHIKKEQINSLQHDFLEFECNKILMIKNKYRMNIHVIPRYQLGENIYEVQENIRLALYEAVNSKKLEFGTPVSYDVLYDTVNSADERIKAASVDYPEYETYAVYKDSNNILQEMRIDMNSSPYQEVNITSFEPDTKYYTYNVNKYYEEVTSTTFDSTKTYYINIYDIDLWNQFRAEIFTKNALTGITPIYDQDTTFSYGVNQTSLDQISSVAYVTTQTTLTPTLKTTTSGTKTYYEYTFPKLRDNESLLLTCPNYIPEPTYPNFSSYVKVVRNLNYDVEANDSYILNNDNEFIAFFWKQSDSDSFYTYVKYDVSDKSLAKIISPTFKLEKSSDFSSDADLLTSFKGLSSGKGTIRPDTNEKLFNFVKSLTNTDGNTNVLTGTQSINILRPNEIHINNTTNGSQEVYWILNETEISTKTSKLVYRIDWVDNEYTLKSGEYFFYTNSSRTSLNILAEGTTLKKTGLTGVTWEVSPVSYESILVQGLDAIEVWCKLPLSNSDKLSATETQQILLGPENQLVITTSKDQDTVPTPTLNNSEYSLSDFTVSYIDESGDSSHSVTNSVNNEWKVRSILNLNMSSDTPQILLDGQVIKCYDSLNSTTPLKTFTGGSRVENDSNGDKTIQDSEVIDNRLFLLSKVAVDKPGGTFVDVKGISLYSGIEVLNDILAYKVVPYNESAVNDGVQYSDSSFVLTVSFDSPDGKKRFLKPFQINKGDYIIQIKTNNDLNSLELSLTTSADLTNQGVSESDIAKVNNVTLTPLYDGASINYFYKLSCSTNNSVVYFTIEGDPKENYTNVFIQPLYKYTKETLNIIPTYKTVTNDDSTLSLMQFEDYILEYVAIYDRNKNFDFSPNNNSGIIKNPLESRQFHNSDHFYNKFTIDEWSERITDITVSTSIR